MRASAGLCRRPAPEIEVSGRLVGRTTSSDLATFGEPLRLWTGDGDAFVASGTAIAYATFRTLVSELASALLTSGC